MEIAKIGEQFLIDGYQPIVLAGSLDENIDAFAEANGLTKSVAEKILMQNSALIGFLNSLESKDDEALISKDADFINETKTISSNPKKKNDTKKISSPNETKTISANHDKATNNVKKTTSDETKVISGNGMFAFNHEAYEKEVEKMSLEEITTIMSTLEEEKKVAMMQGNEYGQYVIEQKENILYIKYKELYVEEYTQKANDEGRVVSAEELLFVNTNLATELRLTRINKKLEYLELKKNNELASEKSTAVQNEDEYQQYICEQKENAIDALNILLNIDKDLVTKQLEKNKEVLNAFSKETLNNDIQNLPEYKSYLANLIETQKKLSDLGEKKSIAMQTENEEEQAKLQKETDALSPTIINLEVQKAELLAKSKGRTLSDEEIAVIKETAQLEIKNNNLSEKLMYLQYQAIELASIKSTAVQYGNEYRQYYCEQKENAIDALASILNMEQEFVLKQKEQYQEVLDFAAKIPNDSNIKNSQEYKTFMEKTVDIQNKQKDLTTQKFIALQTETEEEQAKIQKEIDALLPTVIDLELEKEQLVAKAEGRELSEKAISVIKNKAQLEIDNNQIAEEILINEYKLIVISSQKATAKYNKDNNLIAELEKQEQEIKTKIKNMEVAKTSNTEKIDSLTKELDEIKKQNENHTIEKAQIPVADFYKLLDKDNDGEILSADVITLYNSTNDENLKKILSYLTNGKDVTPAFKLACSGVMYDSYETWNKGITNGTDDPDMLAKNGIITIESLERLTELAKNPSTEAVRAHLEDNRKLEVSIEDFYKMLDSDNDGEIIAEDVIQLYNTTKNKYIKEMLSYLTDGKDVTPAFKLACAGVSYDSYETWNKGITNHTDDPDMLAKNGIITIESLERLTELAKNPSTEAVNAHLEFNRTIEKEDDNKINDEDSDDYNYDIAQKFLEEEENRIKDLIREEDNVDDVTEPSANPDSESPATEIKIAKTSSSLTNEEKNVIGLFGLEEDIVPDKFLYNDDGKIVGLVVAGKKYEAILDDEGRITQLKVTDYNSTKVSNFGEDPKITELMAKANENNSNIKDLTDNIVSLVYKYFNIDLENIIDSVIDDCMYFAQRGDNIGQLSYFITRELGAGGIDVTELKKELDRYSPVGIEFTKLCEQTLQYYMDKKEIEDYIAAHTENVSLNGMNFKVTWAGDTKPEFSFGVLDDGTISILANDCVVDVLGLGDSSKNIQIQGNNITLNTTNITVDKVTNYAKNAIINGSFGNDQIINKPTGINSTINGSRGDDTITNSADNVNINGDEGNDTIINLGENTTINGGEGEDVINTIPEQNTDDDDNNNDDIINIIKPDKPIDLNYKYSQTFIKNGIKFTVYANEEINIETKYYKNLLTINASNCKIVVHSTEKDKSSIQLQGNNIKFFSNTSLSSIFNYANDSDINGSDNEEYIYNYADNVKINAKGSDDKIANEGSNVVIDGGEGADFIQDRANSASVIFDNNDIIKGQTSGSTTQIIQPETKILVNIKSPKGTEEYNKELTSTMLELAINGINYKFEEEPDAEVLAQINALTDKLLTEPNSEGKREINSYAKELITLVGNSNLSDIDAIKEILLNSDTDKNNLTTVEEIDNYYNSLRSTVEDEEITQELENIFNSSSIQSLGLNTSEKNTIITNAGSKAEALKLLKQIQVILNSDEITPYTIFAIKEALLKSQFSFNNEILEDAQMVVEANQTENPNEYIKSKMIIDAKSMTHIEMFNNTKTGDVAEKNGMLYVNDGEKMVRLGISAETYLELFPPIDRYLVEQNNVNDCFFIATALIDYMENDGARAKLLQLFDEDSAGNIIVSFPGVSAYPITFYGGELKESDSQFMQNNKLYTYTKDSVEKVTNNTVTEVQVEIGGAKGLVMLEQAYALAKFAQLSNSSITKDDIDELGEELYYAAKDGAVTDASNLDIDKAMLYYYDGGYAYNVYNDLTFNNNAVAEYKMIEGVVQGKALLAQMAAKLIANKNATITTLITGSTELSEYDEDKYNLIVGHQYAIEKIDTINEIVYVKNPWDAYRVSAIPYDKFLELFYGFNVCEFE